MKRSNKPSKTVKVLEHLKKHGSITSWEAIELYGATRLSAIIFNLRQDYIISGEKIPHVDKYGNSTSFTRYIYCGVKTLPMAG